MTPEQSKAFIKKMFTDVFVNMNSDEAVYSKYFSENYVQYVDGKKLNYPEFKEHMSALKSALKSGNITFKYMLAEVNKVATIHIASGVKKNGQNISIQVNALFLIENEKITLCDELTHLIEGDEADRDIGSRR